MPRANSERKLRTGRALVARGGAAELSIGHVAAAAGVSKALVHYHFKEKEALLRALVENVGLGVIDRAQAAINRVSDEHVLDSYWEWLERELTLGDLRILRALAEYDSERVRAAVRRVVQQRRELTTQHVALVFSTLGLVPRVPAALMGETVLAFVDGLGVGDVQDVALRDRRRLSEDGVLIIVATLASSNGGSAGPPELIARGFGDGSGPLLDELRDEADRVLQQCLRDNISEIKLLQEHLHDEVGQLVYDRTHRRPMILPVVVEV